MPSIANLTVKKNDGVTDVTYTAEVPSSGDKNPALWRNQSVGTAISHRPTLTLSSRSNGSGTARRMEGQLMYPTTVTGTDGKVTVADKAIIGITGVIPLGMAVTDINEAVSQAMNLFVTTLVKDSFKSGYSPT
jgi:hypothetical protein